MWVLRFKCRAQVALQHQRVTMKKIKLHHGISFSSFFKKKKKKKGSLKIPTLPGKVDDDDGVGRDEVAKKKLDFGITGSADRAASSVDATNHNSTSSEPQEDSPESPLSPYRQWSSRSGAFQCLTASKPKRNLCPIGLL